MTLQSRLTAVTAALAFFVSPALAQTEAPAPAAPAQDQGAPQPNDMSGQTPDAMREMMREMMMEMMRGEPRANGERGARAERRDGDRWHHGPRKMRDGRGMRGASDEMRSGMMHGLGMRLMFAVVDADGDGALSVAEVQDFHGRIFKAVDQNKDGRVEMTEIETFFHGSKTESED